MVVALIALVIACGGTATAASVLIRSSSQIAPGAITGSDIHANTIGGSKIDNGAIGTSKLANGAVTPNKLSASVLSRLGGRSGGGTTSTSVGSALEFDRQNGPGNVAANQPTQRVITADNIPAGVYAIFADTNITDLNPEGSAFQQFPTATAQCSVSADADVAYGSNVIGGSYFAGSGNVTMQITHTFAGPGTVTMDCSAPSAWQASGSSILLIRLSSAPRTAVSS